MPTIVRPHEIEDSDQFDPNDEFDHDLVFKVSSPDGTEETTSPDETCDLILDMVEQQFWEWFANPARSRRFKPRVKVYEVS